MKPRRPGAVTAAAVMCIIYGALGSVNGICGGVMLALEKPLLELGDARQVELNKKQVEFIEKESPGLMAYQITELAIKVPLSVCMLFAGFGLLGMKPSSRKLGLIAGRIAIVFTLLRGIYQAVFLIPAQIKAFNTFGKEILQPAGGPPPPQGFVDCLSSIGSVVPWAALVFTVAVLAYLFVIIVLVSHPSARQALLAGGVATDDDRLRDEEARQRERDRDFDRDRGYDDDDYNRGRSEPDDRFRP